jgi:hypothetical protein
MKMSDELKDKLKQILFELGTTYVSLDAKGDESDLDEAVAQIDQAYKDAGYVNYIPKEVGDELANRLTGQEFYDSFIKELQKQNWIGNKESRSYFVSDIDRAARKAAGIA